MSTGRKAPEMPRAKDTFACRELAGFVAGVRETDLPASAFEIARHCVLDLVGVAGAGYGNPAVAAARKFGAAFLPGNQATVWFHGAGLSTAGAAMVNSAAASILDMDDGNRSAGGHPGACIVPACLAVAESMGKSGRDFLTALAIGYEVSVRVSAARNLAALDTFSTGRWCGYGAAAAAGWLAGCDADQIAQAMAITGIHSPIQSASSYSKTGHATKEGIPWATLTGLAALELARNGFTGPPDILDHPDYFDRDKVLRGLGQGWVIEQTYFKPYSCCRWIHASLDALGAIEEEHGLAPHEIEWIEVQTFARAVGLKNQINPESLYGAQFSVPYCLALAALKGRKALQPMSDDALGLEDVVQLASRVKLVVDPDLESKFPARAAARLIIHTARGPLLRQVDYPFGDPANPMGRDALERKFNSLCANRLSAGAREEIVDAVSSLQNGGFDRLIGVLQAPTVRSVED